MPPATPPEAELAQLNQQIEHLEADVALFVEQLQKRAKAASRAGWRLRYLKLAQLVRRPMVTRQSGRIWLLIGAPLAIGVVVLLLIDLLFSAISIAATASLVVVAIAGGALALLLFYPADNLLTSAVAEAETQELIARAHRKDAFDRLTEARQRLVRLTEDRRERMASGRVQRAALLQRPWRTMPDAEWEDFLVEVCRTLGASVDRRGHTDDGSELVVDFGSRRAAVLAKTSRGTINSGTVQNAIAFMRREGCESCAIITSARFTGAAQDYAARNGCRVIGRDEFPDFVLGKIEW
jgi:hypothetical protein